jgi:hypothetical protein
MCAPRELGVAFAHIIESGYIVSLRRRVVGDQCGGNNASHSHAQK